MHDYTNEYEYTLHTMIKEVGGNIEHIVWTHQDGSTSRFVDLNTFALTNMRRFVQLKIDTARSDREALLEQTALQSKQKQQQQYKRKQKSTDLSVPDGIVVGSFTTALKKANAAITAFGFTLFVFDRVLKLREERNLTVSPRLAKLRQQSTTPLTLRRT